jgi:energy-converting hydrogenase Eha subunit F
MGKQIGFYFAPQDEDEMSRFLVEKDLLCIPRVCSTPSPEPVVPSLALHLEVSLVHRDFADMAIQNLSSPNQQFWQLTTEGLCIEWYRNKSNTIMSDRYSGTAIYSHPGRFYFRTLSPTSRQNSVLEESSRCLDRVMAAVVRRVKKLSSERSVENGPYYVGRHLASMVKAGKAQLFYANGVSPMRTRDL